MEDMIERLRETLQEKDAGLVPELLPRVGARDRQIFAQPKLDQITTKIIASYVQWMPAKCQKIVEK
jgi:hypothetical protein